MENQVSLRTKEELKALQEEATKALFEIRKIRNSTVPLLSETK